VSLSLNFHRTQYARVCSIKTRAIDAASVTSSAAPDDTFASILSSRKVVSKNERGYTLVALLALMTILAISMLAAAPNLQRQAQREREKEAIRRGEEVAEAIRQFVHKKGVLPKSMDELIEGVTPPGSIKKLQILRAAAARDPLSSSGEWILVKPNSQRLIEFQREVVLYAGGRQVPTSDKAIEKFFNVSVTNVVNLDTRGETPGDEDASTSSVGEFIGVASRSRRESVLTYYGIERHDKWVFTPLFK